MYDPTSSHRQSIIYATFTTPDNSIPGSAVCAFRIDDIMAAFEGRFKSQRDSTSNWLPIAKEAVPDPRPGRCVEDSRTLHTLSVNFIKTHTLMETAVKSMHKRPLLTRVNLKHRFTAITVDPQIRGLDGNFYDVIFVGTDDGRVLKIAHIYGENPSAESTIITETQVLGNDQPVRELSVSRSTANLIVVGSGKIVAIPLHHCKKITLCRDCLNLQDPYCAWDIRNRECTTLDLSSDNANTKPVNFIQKLKSVEVDLCKKHGEIGSWMDAAPKVVLTSRGKLVSVGRESSKSLDNTYSIASDEPSDLTNEINQIRIVDSPLLQSELASGNAEMPTDRVQMGSPSIIILAFVLFVTGIMAGVFVSRLRHRFSPCYNEHRNQINA